MKRRVARLALVTSVVAVGSKNPAGADAFGTGSNGAPLRADEAPHTYCYGSGFNVGLRNNADWAMEISIQNGTDLDVALEACDISGTEQTDIRWFDGALPGTTRAQWECDVLQLDDPFSCERGAVTLDVVQLNVGDLDEQDITKSSCHEAGHSLGMPHGPGGGNSGQDDCMISGELPADDAIYYTYSNHHKNHVNATY